MTMYKKVAQGWVIMREQGGKWVQTGFSGGHNIGQATNGQQQNLTVPQIRLVNKRQLFLTQ